MVSEFSDKRNTKINLTKKITLASPLGFGTHSILPVPKNSAQTSALPNRCGVDNIRTESNPDTLKNLTPTEFDGITVDKDSTNSIQNSKPIVQGNLIGGLDYFTAMLTIRKEFEKETNFSQIEELKDFLEESLSLTFVQNLKAVGNQGKGRFKVSEQSVVLGNSLTLEVGYPEILPKEKIVIERPGKKPIIKFLNPEHTKVYVIVTGQALARLTFQEQIKFLQGLQTRSFAFKATRLDFKVDCAKFFVPFGKIKRSFNRNEFKGLAKDINTKKGKTGAKNWQENTQSTIYFGTQNSSQYRRIYDSGLKHPELANYYRFETQYRRNLAQSKLEYLLEIESDNFELVIRAYKTLIINVIESMPLLTNVRGKAGKYCDHVYWARFKNIIYQVCDDIQEIPKVPRPSTVPEKIFKWFDKNALPTLTATYLALKKYNNNDIEATREIFVTWLLEQFDAIDDKWENRELHWQYVKKMLGFYNYFQQEENAYKFLEENVYFNCSSLNVLAAKHRQKLQQRLISNDNFT